MDCSVQPFFVFWDYNDYKHRFFQPLINSLWTEFFKLPIDELPSNSKFILFIKKYIFEKEWYEFYDLIECVLSTQKSNIYDGYTHIYNSYNFIKDINLVLKSELSAFTIINYQITEITSEQEIQSIEEALANTNPFSGIQQNLNQALKLMSDRQKPDYKNSIKESISAVEALAMQLLEDNSITLGKAIPRLRTKYELHPTLMESLNKLYGYSSDESGVRHGSPKESSLSYIDAKFMLVACTNFINYLIEKTK